MPRVVVGVSLKMYFGHGGPGLVRAVAERVRTHPAVISARSACS